MSEQEKKCCGTCRWWGEPTVGMRYAEERNKRIDEAF
jgi:hypothetical protein